MLAGAGKWSVREAHCERKGISGTTAGCCLTRPPRTRPRISRGRAGLPRSRRGTARPDRPPRPGGGVGRRATERRVRPGGHPLRRGRCQEALLTSEDLTEKTWGYAFRGFPDKSHIFGLLALGMDDALLVTGLGKSQELTWIYDWRTIRRRRRWHSGGEEDIALLMPRSVDA